MRILFSAVLILLAFCCARSQDEEYGFAVPPADSSDVSGNRSVNGERLEANIPRNVYVPIDVSSGEAPTNADKVWQKQYKGEGGAESQDCCKKAADSDRSDAIDREVDSDAPATKEKFHWKPALIESLAFLGFQHSFRMTQEKTRRELGGPFFRDWKRSVQSLRGWRDGDSFATNYIAHPLQGAFTGRIFVNNSDRAKKQEFGTSKKYWESRMKALAWSAVWSTQFELGPISEATIGNVGMYKKNGQRLMAYVDLVVTPVVGTAVLIGEDAIDKYFLKNWLERKSNNKIKIRILRSLLTPTTSISNMIRGKVPWKRDDRSIVGREALIIPNP